MWKTQKNKFFTFKRSHHLVYAELSQIYDKYHFVKNKMTAIVTYDLPRCFKLQISKNLKELVVQLQVFTTSDYFQKSKKYLL